MLNFFKPKKKLTQTIFTILENIMTTQEDITAKLTQVAAQLDKVTAALSEALGELGNVNTNIQNQNNQIAELQAEVSNAVNAAAAAKEISPDLQAALDSVASKLDPISVQSQALADIFPNVVGTLETAVGITNIEQPAGTDEGTTSSY